jgi:hypothetical protein
MVFTAKKNSKTGLQILPKNNPYLSQKLRKREAVVQVLSSKKKLSCIYSVFEYSLRTLGEALLEKNPSRNPQNSMA